MRFTLQSLLISFVVIWSALAAFGLWGIAVAAVLLGIAADVRTANHMWSAIRHLWSTIGQINFSFLVWLVPTLLILSLFSWPYVAPFIYGDLGPRNLRSCANNLKNLGLALANYQEANGCFPPAYTADANGKPMHSWRVLLLPFIELKSFYDAFHLDEPWDSPGNGTLATRCAACCPREYVCPGDSEPWVQPSTLTSYVAVVGSNTAWPRAKSAKRSDIPDRGRHTIMLVEVPNCDIQWTEPRDVTVEEAIRAIRAGPHMRPNGYFYHDTPGAWVAFVDSSVHYLPTDTPTETLQALLTIGDKKTHPDIDIEAPGSLPSPSLHWAHITALLVLAGSFLVLVFRPVHRAEPQAASPESPIPNP